MTGYGKAVVEYGEKKINVEVKSLNSKTLDLSTRIAPIYREKEMQIRQMVSQALTRGKVDFSIWIEKDTVVDATPVNGALVAGYYKQIKEIIQKNNIPEPQTVLTSPDQNTTCTSSTPHRHLSSPHQTPPYTPCPNPLLYSPDALKSSSTFPSLDIIFSA